MRRRTRSSFLALSFVLLAIVAACSAKQTSLSPAGAGAQTAARADAKPCDRSDQDSSSYAHVPLYRECAVDVKARPNGRAARPEFMPPKTDGGCYFVAIEVVVDSSGIPEPRTARVLRTNDSMFATAVLSTIPTFGFSPARIGGVAVRQIFELSTALTTYASKSAANPTGPIGPSAGKRPPCATRR